ncbi:MAG: NAD(P)/FAD-dependent oxidoreductase [Myxococcota bacterium]
MSEGKKVVIVGAGFAGLRAATELAKAPERLDITVVDRRNHHLFQPLLYQVATAGLSPADITWPIRTALRPYKNVRVLMAEATGVDSEESQLLTSEGPIDFDYLVLTCGATHSYFGNDQWSEVAPGLKTVGDATSIRTKILTSFERAEVSRDIDERRAHMTFVIVGGGPTGVELAGSVGELSRYTLTNDFRNIDPRQARIILVEAGPSILAGYHGSLSRAAVESLERFGVQVWTHKKVTGIDENGVDLGNERVEAKTVLWAAGVKASPIGRNLATTDRVGRIQVKKDLTLDGYENVFVAGDQAYFEDEKGKPLPGIAPVAIQQGKHVAKNLLKSIRGQQLVPFRYFDKGMMATVGRAAAVMQVGGFRMNGFFAWLAWCVVHIFFLIGFRNRLLVSLQWAWSYFRYRRGARLITEPRLDFSSGGDSPTSSNSENASAKGRKAASAGSR